jgi:ketosteroid isomerase-like protein
MTMIVPGTLIEQYYGLIDANDVAAVLRLFADDAVYERADATYAGKPRITRFFTEERQIRGRHVLEAIYSLDRKVIVSGRFEGVGAAGDARSVGFADFWTFDVAGLVTHRRTYLATGHQIVER